MFNLSATSVSTPAIRSKATALADATGARAASSRREVANNCSSIITMLPNTLHVEDIYLGNKSERSDAATSVGGVGPESQEKDQDGEGLIDLVEEGTLLVDSSTIDPLTSKRIGNMAARKVRHKDGCVLFCSIALCRSCLRNLSPGTVLWCLTLLKGFSVYLSGDILGGCIL